MPAFHCVDDGSGLSYSYTLSDEGASVARPPPERLQLPVAQRDRSARRRIEHLREDRVAGGAIEVQPAAAAQDELLPAGEVVGHAETRRQAERRLEIGR